MSDPRFNSCHLEFPRRQDYRRAREAVLAARGWLTRAGEYAENLVDAEQWPSLLPVQAEQVLPGVRYVLVDLKNDHVYGLNLGLTTLGRRKENDIVFSENVVSRRHCVLLVHALGNCELHDTASRNGTFVNGRQIQGPVRLTSGDEITVCDHRLRFLSTADCASGGDGEDRTETTFL
jgi:hypothetical protein